MKIHYLKSSLKILSITLLIAFAFAYFNLPSLPPLQQFITKAESYDVEILRDNLGIPHVYGEKDIDTAFGLGYVQSEDDFETLQTVLLATRGTLAAENGFKASKTDFVVQFMGVWDTVNAHYESKVPKKIKAIAQAYADGINVYAAQHPDKVSRYLLPVNAKDIVAGFTFKTPMFYGFDKALGELIDPNEPHELAKDDAALTWQPNEQLPIGSQGIAIAPHRSSDGLTRLLVNSHQPLTGPVAWYEVRLHSEEGWNMVGSTFPGAPVIVHGHNQNLGWANTVNKPDLVDFYKMEVNPENEYEYLLDGQWQTFEVKTAKIKVKLLGPFHWTFEKEIKISKHGPTMQTEHGLYAARWAGMNEVRTLEFMFATNKASNQQEFESALKLNAMPSINFIYADKEGNIAHYYNAKFPKRIDGWQWDKILPGDISSLIWHDYLDYTMMPKTINPTTGLVYNANNPPFMATDGNDDAKPTDFPKSMGIETFITNRALQIESIMSELPSISAQDLKDVKYNLSYHPQSNQIRYLNKWLALDLSQQLSSEENDAKTALHGWNYSTHKNNKLAALAVMTMAPVQKARGKKLPLEQITVSFQQSFSKLIQFHGQYDVPFGNVMRLIHGDQNLAISGGPDILRAVYGKEINEQGQTENIAGDGFMMFVAWDEDGLVSSEAGHQYGSATLDKSSPHYNDQMQTFVEQKERKVLFNRSDLDGQVTQRYHPKNGVR